MVNRNGQLIVSVQPSSENEPVVNNPRLTFSVELTQIFAIMLSGNASHHILGQINKRKFPVLPGKNTSTDQKVLRHLETFQSFNVRGNATHVEMHPLEPLIFAATHGNMVQLVDDTQPAEFDLSNNDSSHASASAPVGRRIITFSNFQREAFSASFRPQDGELLVVGGEEGTIRIFRTDFSAKSKTPLRSFERAHQSSVHVTRFLTNYPQLSFSCGDDRRIKLWDIATGTSVRSIEQAHDDYIRAACNLATTRATLSSFGDQSIATGGYDHVVNLWDMKQSKKVVTLMSPVKQPIEYLLSTGGDFKSGGNDNDDGGNNNGNNCSDNYLLAASGANVIIWDVRMGQVVHTISQHLNTVTCMAQSHNYLFTSSLDRYVHVYKWPTKSKATVGKPQQSAVGGRNKKVASKFKIPFLRSIPFASPILSIAFAEQHHVKKTASTEPCRMLVSCAGGKLHKSMAHVSFKKLSGDYLLHDQTVTQNYRNMIRPQIAEQTIRHTQHMERSKLLAEFGPSMRQFRYKKVLEQALRRYGEHKPTVVLLVWQELKQRNEHWSALDARCSRDLLPLLSFMHRWIRDITAQPVILHEMAPVVLDIYGRVVGQDERVDQMVRLLRREVTMELKMQEQMEQLKAMLDVLLF